MMEDRLRLANNFMGSNGVSFISIDHNERDNLEQLLTEVHGDENRIGELIWHNVTDNNPTRIASEHEYIECYAKSLQRVAGEWKSPLSDAKNVLIRIGNELLAEHGDTPSLRNAYQEWFKENKRFLGQMDRMLLPVPFLY